MTGSSEPLRIGGVPFGVGAPLLDGLDDVPDLRLVRAVPTQLIAALRAGELDAALVSSIEGFRRPGYRAIAGIGICCRGAVRSVRAFRRPGVAGIATVGVTDQSAASVALLEILLDGPLAGEPDRRIERVPSTRTPAALPHDLVLLIGDDGLSAEAGDREVIDLGAAWREWTGLPFVFALWLVRPGADAERIGRHLSAAHARACARPRSAAEGGVHYELGPAEREGLRRYRDEAVRMGLASAGVEPLFVG